MEKSADRRAEERAPLTQPVCFELTADSGCPGNLVIQGTGTDLSAEGLGITTHYPVRAGQIVRLLIPGSVENRKIPVFSEVAWSTAGGGWVRAGLRFLV